MFRTVAVVCVICMGLGQFAVAGENDKDKDKDQAKSAQSSDIYGYRGDEPDTWQDQDQSWQRDRSDQWRSDQYSGRTNGQTWRERQDRSQYGYMGQDRYEDRAWGQRDQDWQRDTFRDQDRDRQSQQWMRGERQDRMMGGQSVAIMGRITNEDASIRGADPNNKLVQIRSRQGTTLFVDLGPAQDAENLNLSQNQPIFVRGELSSIGGQRVLMAREVARVSQVTSIDRSRDDFSRQQFRGSQEYGYIDGSERGGQDRWSQQFGRQGQQSQQYQQRQHRPGQSGSGDWYYGEER